MLSVAAAAAAGVQVFTLCLRSTSEFLSCFFLLLHLLFFPLVFGRSVTGSQAIYSELVGNFEEISKAY